MSNPGSYRGPYYRGVSKHEPMAGIEAFHGGHDADHWGTPGRVPCFGSVVAAVPASAKSASYSGPETTRRRMTRWKDTRRVP